MPPGLLASLVTLSLALFPTCAPAQSRYPRETDPVTLAASTEDWRQGQFEIYRWSALPGFLLFDTESYETQSRFFKRLAFFVEKKGYTGRIEAYSVLEPLRGYKAHNYYAADLAAFFDTAAQLKIPLLEEEEILKEILIANGILSKRGRFLTPGRGGLLSVSRQASPTLRRLHLVHELTHAVFYAQPEYRRACELIWQDLTDTEREFWRVFLLWKDYNVVDPYLLINEFQAYVLQQSRDGVEGYVRQHSIGSMLSEVPGQRVLLERVRMLEGSPFRDNHRKLHRAMEFALEQTGQSAVLDTIDALLGASGP